MGRRTSSGRIGAPTFGGLLADAQTITSDDNKDIIFDPTGTGIVKTEAHFQIQNQNSLRFGDADDSNYVAFQAPTTVGSNITWTLPDSDGTNLQGLVTDGNGNLSFTDLGLTLSDTAVDSQQNNLVFTTSTTGSLTTINVSSTKLQFQPSTGTLTTTELTVNGTARSLRTENIQTGNYTLALSDRNKVVAMNNTTDVSVTVPADSSVNFPVGSVVHIARVNTGNVTLAAAGGVTLSRTGSFGSDEEIYCRKRSADNWIVVDQPGTSFSGSGGDTVSQSGSQNIHSYTSDGASTFTVS